MAFGTSMLNKGHSTYSWSIINRSGANVFPNKTGYNVKEKPCIVITNKKKKDSQNKEIRELSLSYKLDSKLLNSLSYIILSVLLKQKCCCDLRFLLHYTNIMRISKIYKLFQYAMCLIRFLQLQISHSVTLILGLAHRHYTKIYVDYLRNLLKLTQRLKTEQNI